LSNFGSGIAKDRIDAPGLSVGVDECAAFNPVVTFPVDGCPKVTVEIRLPRQPCSSPDGYLLYRFVSAFADGNHRDERCYPNEDAEYGKSRAQLVPPDCLRSGSGDHHPKAQKGAGGTHLGTLGFAPVELCAGNDALRLFGQRRVVTLV
jgi:hypothetical protein